MAMLNNQRVNDFSWSNPVINKAHIWVTWRADKISMARLHTVMIPMIPFAEPRKRDDESYLSEKLEIAGVNYINPNISCVKP